LTEKGAGAAAACRRAAGVLFLIFVPLEKLFALRDFLGFVPGLTVNDLHGSTTTQRQVLAGM